MSADEPTPDPVIPDDLRLRLPAPYVTIVLIALNVAAFGLSVMHGTGLAVPNPDALVAVGGNLPTLTLHGEPWRLVTAMFLHGGLLHLAMNMLCLWGGGRTTEFLLGRRSMLAIYLSAGLVGGIVSAARGTMIVSVGASGAIFGLFGAILAYLIVHRDVLDPTVRAKQMKSMTSFVGLNLLLGLGVSGIDLAAHVGGFVAGFVMVFGADRGLDLRDRAGALRRRFPRVMLATALAVGVVVAGLVLVPKPPAGYITHDEGQAVAALDVRFKRFAASETDLLARQDDLQKQAEAGKVTDQELGRVIDEELLPQWRSLHHDLDSVPGLPAVIVPRQQAAVAYVQARVAHLEALSAMLHLGPEDPGLAAAQAMAARRITEINTALEALKQAIK